MKVVTFNINYSRRADESFLSYTLENRLPHIITKVKDINPDVIALQEVHKDSLADIKSKLSDYDFEFIYQNSRGGNLTLIGLGLKREVFKSYNYLLSSFNFGEFMDGNETAILCYIEDTSTLIISVHFPMSEANRKNTVANFNKLLSHYSHKRLVIMGDFNSFPDSYGYEQIPELNAVCGTYSATEFAINESNKKYAKKSFIPYPFDYVDPNILKLEGKLDHILAKGFKVINGSAIVYDSLIPKTNIGLSDHYAISVDLEVLHLEK